MATVLTSSQLDELRRKLQDERARLLRVLEVPASDDPARDQQTEFEEAAQRTTEADRALAVGVRERALLGEVEGALKRMDAGTYGVSERTGDPIRYERLAAMPWARFDTIE